MLQIVAAVEVIVCWIAWLSAFVFARKRAAGQTKVVRAPASRWGIIIQGIGFGFMTARVRPVGFEKSDFSLIAAMIIAPATVWLGWAAATHLGKQWRFEAALSENHDLIQTGPYRLVRHPIYASMLGLLLSMGFVWAWWPMFVAGVVVFLIGTEIRVRLEDRLLAERFQDQFTRYRSSVRAYIPLIR